MFSNKRKQPTNSPTLSHNPTPTHANKTQSASLATSPQLLNHERTLYLQRTIGNQSTLNLVTPRIQRDLDFDAPKWKKAKNVKALGNGVNEVYGVDNLVIKGLSGGGAQQEFASQVYGGLVEAPQTRAVQVNTPEGQEIIQCLNKHGLLPEGTLKTDTTVLLIMKKSPLRSMEDFTKELGIVGDPNPLEIAKNKLRKGKTELKETTSFDAVIDKIFASNFFNDLGKIHAVDLFLGNTDRMDRYGEVAMQNIFINVSNGNYGSLGLDLDVEAASLAKVKSSGKNTGTQKQGNQKRYEAPDADKYKNWVLHSIKGSDAKRDLVNTADSTDVMQDVRFGYMKGGMDSTDVTALFDPTRIALAIDQFRANLEKWFPKPPADQEPANERERRGDMIGTPYYTTTLWPLAHQKFYAGIATGITKIRAEMKPDGQYAQFYAQSLKHNPKEDLFDFAVLQIRDKYFELKQDPYRQYTEAEIMGRLEAFAERLDKGWAKRF